MLAKWEGFAIGSQAAASHDLGVVAADEIPPVPGVQFLDRIEHGLADFDKGRADALGAPIFEGADRDLAAIALGDLLGGQELLVGHEVGSRRPRRRPPDRGRPFTWAHGPSPWRGGAFKQPGPGQDRDQAMSIAPSAYEKRSWRYEGGRSQIVAGGGGGGVRGA